MIEATGDLFTHPADVRVIPTNGVVRNGRLVMGAGVAKAAADRLPWLPDAWGGYVTRSGNRAALQPVATREWWLSWPTKHHYRDPSDLRLILDGVADVMWLVASVVVLTSRDPVVVLPRLGCGLGGLSWAEVGPRLAKVLDDRFVVLTPPGGK